MNPKDGFAVLECKDVRTRRVLEFLIPFLYSEKPTQVTITIGNTIFGALSGEKKIDLALVIRNVVQRLFFGVEKSKFTPICSSFIFISLAMP